MSRPGGDYFPEDDFSEFSEEAEEGCEGVVECTALVLSEAATEMDGKITLFGVLDELRVSAEGTEAAEETSFVVYAKFEGCEHAAGEERWSRFILSDGDGGILQESEEYRVTLAGAEEPATLIVRFELPADVAGGERVLWIEAVLDDETLAQTAVRVQSQYSV
ncbi:hypothetical protein [Rubrobacter aplysinae]|uniref:hypothetical protein n=1 Tax=Rubrobacter aplysinae TaxID=909625 RepID=UPI00128E685B|nr:hypothetical protein [Rubrobacter aplysinae]